MITLEIKGDKKLEANLKKGKAKLTNLTVLHKRMALKGQQWVAQTFQKQGRPKWKALSPNTVAGRRLFGGGAKILQDKGLLRASFLGKGTRQSAIVGSSRRVSKIHEDGVKPFGPILPKKQGGVLAFPVAGGFVFARSIKRHPGIVARPMLPTKKQAEVEVTQPTTQQYLTELIKKSFGN